MPYSPASSATAPNTAPLGQSAEVHIHGRGPVAMTLALLLARNGRRVSISERKPPASTGPTSSGQVRQPELRAYALNAASQQILTELKVWQALPPSAVCAVHDMRVFGDNAANPTQGLHFSAYEQRVAALAHIVDAAALTDALEQALGFAAGVHTAAGGVRGPGTALQVWAEGGRTSERAAWMQRVGLDALNDETRRDYGSTGHTAIAARLSQADGAAARQHCAWQWFGGDRHAQDVLALLPLGTSAAASALDGRTPPHWALVWSLPQDRAQALLALAPAAFEAALNARVPTGSLGGQLTLASDRQSWPLKTTQLSRWVGPGWAVVGDAAHLIHPLAGQGLNLGLADAACLARVLRDPADAWRSLGDENRLARYERERRAATSSMQQAVDGLWQAFALPGPLAASVRNWGLSAFNATSPLKRWVAAQALG